MVIIDPKTNQPAYGERAVELQQQQAKERYERIEREERERREEFAKSQARNAYLEAGGSLAEFEKAWPRLREEKLKQAAMSPSRGSHWHIRL